MPLPPAHGPNGEVLDLDDEELYRHWAKTLLMNHAGGWSPDSIPGQNATREFEAFVRETQARAVDALFRLRGGPGVSPWMAERYIEDIREGRVDLSGNRR